MENLPQTKPDEQNYLTIIERLAVNPDVDPDKIQKFLDMQERILDRNAKQAFNAAMNTVQDQIELVVAKIDNLQTKSKYADLKSILREVKPIYTQAGFSLMFYEEDSAKEGQKRICCDIGHREGHTEKRHVDVTVQTTGIQGKAMMTQIHGEGSAISYGRRYLTCMIFNIPTGDDDGNAAGKTDYIDDKERGVIVDLINSIEDGIDMERFLTLMGAPEIEQIKKADYQKAVSALQAKKKASKK